jgi:aminoglycoside 3-N-acetyltransferase
MANTGLFNKIIAISPYIELLIRRVYWSNKSFFRRFKVLKTPSSTLKSFEKILNKILDFGLHSNDILVLHSSYDALQSTDVSPNEIIEQILGILGENGTLVMNSARSFPEEKAFSDYFDPGIADIVVNYNTRKSRVWTGVLPFTMIRDKRSKISKLPLNPIVAIGKQSELMLSNELLDNELYSCGVNSGWNYCVNKNALIVSIGVDLTHSLTIMHVVEDQDPNNWPIKNWYRDRKFRIIDPDSHYDEVIKVKERAPQWGALCFAERTLCKDLLNAGILKSVVIDGVLVEALRAQELVTFLKNSNKSGYPYFKFC